MKIFLVFIFYTGALPNFTVVSEIAKMEVCEVAAKIFQQRSPDGARGKFDCLRIDGPKPKYDGT